MDWPCQDFNQGSTREQPILQLVLNKLAVLVVLVVLNKLAVFVGDIFERVKSP